jgi:hypothetical protein
VSIPARGKIEDLILAAKLADASYDGGAMVPPWKIITNKIGIEKRLLDDTGLYYNKSTGSLWDGFANAAVFKRGNEVVVSFRGTQQPGDILDYPDLKDRAYIQYFEPLLKAVYSWFGNDHNYTFVGHSLGGAAVNQLASMTDGLYRHFSRAEFYAISSPLITPGVTNFGSDNDPVYQAFAEKDDSRFDTDNLHWVTSQEDVSSVGDNNLDAHSLVNSIDILSEISSGAFLKEMNVNDLIFFVNTSDSLIVSDSLSGGFSRAFYVGNDEINIVSTTGLHDWVDLRGGNDAVASGGGNDRLKGGDGDDRLLGQADADILWGGEGNDTLRGGLGADKLYGEMGLDTFLFAQEDLDPVAAATGDIIYDFQIGDRIDVTGIDGDLSKAGDQDLTFIGTEAFSGRSGQLRVITQGGNTLIQLDLDGGKQADYTITLKGLHSLALSDFMGVKESAGNTYEAVLTGKITWAAAKAMAEQMGGHLATITSAAEDALVFSLINDPKYWSPNGNHGPWLGGYQPAGSPEPAGGWTWVTGEAWTYSNWAPGQPGDIDADDGAHENILHYHFPNGGVPMWNDWHDGSSAGPELDVVAFVVEYEG